MRSFINIIITALSLLVYASVLVPPSSFWWMGFVSLAIPFVLAFNFVMLVWYMIRLKKSVLYPLIVLLSGIPFIRATWSFNPHEEKPADAFLSVMSYNIRYFKDSKARNYGEFSKATMNYALDQDCEILCFQEFYSHPKYPNLDMVSRLKEKGYEVRYLNLTLGTVLHGLAIFSRFPIIDSKNIHYQDNSLNGAMYCDLQVKEDTIRVFNVHLRSMGLDSREIMSPEIKEKYKDVANSLRSGFTARSRQVDQLLQLINESPYPVIVCGDLNDVPYSYSYFKLRRTLLNAFEKAGQQFGFTYNGKMRFLRIDNQFYSKKLMAKYFKVDRTADHSDHFPIKGYYEMELPENASSE